MQLFNILTEGDGSIRSMMAQFVNAQKKDARRAQNKWLGMIQARLMDLGFNYKRRRMIVSQLVTIADQKQFDNLIAQYKLFGNYSKTFKHTEATLINALREAEEGEEEPSDKTEKKFKLVLQIPYTTADDKDQKERKFKYDMSINDIEIEGLTPVNVSELKDGVLDFQIVAYIKTSLTRTEVTAVLEPDYVIHKMQRLDQKPADDEAEDDGDIK
tara:strand:- start:3844 stop:4485 length:642 start_codon:yes stop_codon:yes gene_type:complete